jgi:hypothetical protein
VRVKGFTARLRIPGWDELAILFVYGLLISNGARSIGEEAGMTSGWIMLLQFFLCAAFGAYAQIYGWAKLDRIDHPELYGNDDIRNCLKPGEGALILREGGSMAEVVVHRPERPGNYGYLTGLKVIARRFAEDEEFVKETAEWARNNGMGHLVTQRLKGEPPNEQE